MYYKTQTGYQYITVWPITQKILRGLISDFKVKMERAAAPEHHVQISLLKGDGRAFITKCQQLWPEGTEHYGEGGWPHYRIPLYHNEPKLQEVSNG